MNESYGWKTYRLHDRTINLVNKLDKRKEINGRKSSPNAKIFSLLSEYKKIKDKLPKDAVLGDMDVSLVEAGLG